MIADDPMKNRLQTLLVIKNRTNRRYQKKAKRHSTYKKISLVSVMGLLILVAVIPLVGGYFFIELTKDLPSAEWIPAYLDPQKGILLEPTTLYDRSGENEIHRLQHPGNTRKFLSLDPNQTDFISPYVVQLTVATKQPDFWSSSGYNKQLFSSGQDRTIAEELVERLLLCDESPGLRRDLRMRLLASQMVEKYGRAQVLEWYLNSVAYGHYTIGISSAAQLYYNKNATGLNMAEAALMVATSLTPALNPLDAPKAALENQMNLLTTLNERGFVSDQDFTTARQTSINIATDVQPLDRQANTFSNLVLNELYDLYGRERVELGGFKVTTTLDYSIQQALSCTLSSQINKLKGNNSGNQPCEPERLLPSLFENLPSDLNLLGSGAILDSRTGNVVALVGNTNGRSELSILDTKQGGSILTPLIAVNAFVRGFSPATQVWDIPNNLPENLTSYQLPMGAYKGPMRFRTAIANNYLAGITKMYDQIGYDVIRRSANSFGLSTISNLPEIQEILFSGDSTNILEVAHFYSIFSNLGIRYGKMNPVNGSITPKTIQQIELSDGLQLENILTESQVILSPQLAFLVHDILRDDYERRETLGFPNPLEIGRPSAAKYGSTFHNDEIWTAGYTPQFVTVIWFGQEGEEILELNPSISGGVWYAIMQWLHKDLPAENWQKPIGLTETTVCFQSGLLPTRECPTMITELFIEGTQPSIIDNLYRRYEINRETQLLATVFTPPELIDTRIFMIVPEVAEDWAAFNGIATPPKDYDLIQAPRRNENVLITSPKNFSYINGVVDILATVQIENISNYRIQVGQGLNPSNWLQLGEDQTRRITNRKITDWDTTLLEDGLYALRLLVIKDDLQIETHTIQISIDNTLPSGNIVYPRQDQTVPRSSQGTLTLQADVYDSVGIEKVEWWLDGTKVAIITQPPYSYPINITSGEHRLFMVIYDLAGNSEQTEEFNFSVE